MESNAAAAAAAAARAQAELGAPRRGERGARGLAELIGGPEENGGVANPNANANANGAAGADVDVDVGGAGAGAGAGAAPRAMPRDAGQADVVAGARPMARPEQRPPSARISVPGPGLVPPATPAPDHAPGSSAQVEEAGRMPPESGGISPPDRRAWPGFGPSGAKWERAIAESRELTEFIHRHRSMQLVNTGAPSLGGEICGALVVS